VLAKEGKGIRKASTNSRPSDVQKLEIMDSIQKTFLPRKGSCSFKILGEDNHGDWFVIVNTKLLNKFTIALEHVILPFETPWEIKFSADGEYLASGGRTSSMIYHTGTGKKIGHFSESKGGIFSDVYLNGTRPLRRSVRPRPRCISTNGKYLVTGGDDRIIKIWDIRTEEAKGELKGHASSIVKVEISADGNNLLSASQDCVVIYWDLERQIKLFELSSEQGAPTSLAISPNGNLLAAAGFVTDDYETGKEVLVWNTDGKLITALETGAGGGVVQFSPDGNQLFVGGFHGPSDIWEFDSQVIENGGWRSKCPKLSKKEYWQALSWKSNGPWALSKWTYGCKAYDVMSGLPLFHLEVPSEPMSISLFSRLIEKLLKWRMLQKTELD
jgi:glucose repression regulatory protein TUP1